MLQNPTAILDRLEELKHLQNHNERTEEDTCGFISAERVVVDIVSIRDIKANLITDLFLNTNLFLSINKCTHTLVEFSS